jgi:hypothetical protein
VRSQPTSGFNVAQKLIQFITIATDGHISVRDAFEIDWLTVLAVALTGANGTEETVFSKNPHAIALRR